MAFSYSDKNFTVIGNLCFVHIHLDGTETHFDIPPAISDRMLLDGIVCSYKYYTNNKARIVEVPDPEPITGFASISIYEIVCHGVGEGYLYLYFPIDSNK